MKNVSAEKRRVVRRRAVALLRLFLVWAIVFLLVSIAQTAYPQETTEHQKPNTITLTIDQAINLALQTNRNIISSRNNTESRQLSLVSAQSEFALKIVPSGNVILGGGTLQNGNNIGAGLSLQKKFEAGTIISAGPRVDKIDHQLTTDMVFSIQQPLLRGFGKDVNLDNIRTVQFSIKSVERILYQTKVNTVLEVVSAFYDALKQEDLVRLNESLIGRLKGHSEVAKAKEKVGLATAMDTYRAEIRLKDTEDALSQSVQAYRDSKDRLKIILPLPLETELEITAPREAEPMYFQEKTAVETAIRNRIEVEQAAAEIKEAERKSEILKKNILPDLTVVVAHERITASSGQLINDINLTQSLWTLRLQSSTDIFRTAEKSAYQQSLLNTDTLRINLETRKDDVRKQVRSQFTALKEAEKRIDIRKEQIKQAEGKLALAEVKFSNAMADNFDIIEAETELQRARVNLLSAQTDYIVGIYNMKAVTGTLLERDK